MSKSDPGYGDPNAPIGSPEWAKRWRLGFQNVVKVLRGAKSFPLFQLPAHPTTLTSTLRLFSSLYYGS